MPLGGTDLQGHVPIYWLMDSLGYHGIPKICTHLRIYIQKKRSFGHCFYWNFPFYSTCTKYTISGICDSDGSNSKALSRYSNIANQTLCGKALAFYQLRFRKFSLTSGWIYTQPRYATGKSGWASVSEWFDLKIISLLVLLWNWKLLITAKISVTIFNIQQRNWGINILCEIVYRRFTVKEV